MKHVSYREEISKTFRICVVSSYYFGYLLHMNATKAQASLSKSTVSTPPPPQSLRWPNEQLKVTDKDSGKYLGLDPTRLLRTHRLRRMFGYSKSNRIFCMLYLLVQRFEKVHSIQYVKMYDGQPENTHQYFV